MDFIENFLGDLHWTYLLLSLAICWLLYQLFLSRWHYALKLKKIEEYHSAQTVYEKEHNQARVELQSFFFRLATGPVLTFALIFFLGLYFHVQHKATVDDFKHRFESNENEIDASVKNAEHLLDLAHQRDHRYRVLLKRQEFARDISKTITSTELEGLHIEKNLLLAEKISRYTESGKPVWSGEIQGYVLFPSKYPEHFEIRLPKKDPSRPFDLSALIQEVKGYQSGEIICFDVSWERELPISVGVLSFQLDQKSQTVGIHWKPMTLYEHPTDVFLPLPAKAFVPLASH